MRERILMAEKKVDVEKIRNIEALEINLQLSHPPEAGRYQQPSKPVPSFQGYPSLIPEKRGYPRENVDARKTARGMHKSANVRVNSITVNVKTTPV